jgi:hypothetical protein
MRLTLVQSTRIFGQPLQVIPPHGAGASQFAVFERAPYFVITKIGSPLQHRIHAAQVATIEEPLVVEDVGPVPVPERELKPKTKKADTAA